MFDEKSMETYSNTHLLDIGFTLPYFKTVTQEHVQQKIWKNRTQDSLATETKIVRYQNKSN